MQIIITKSSQELAYCAAQHVRKVLEKNANAVLGLPTGTTPITLYKQLVHDYQNDKISFNGVTTFNLDEYVGLPPDHPQSYRSFMNRHLFDHIDIELSRTHVPSGTGTSTETAQTYEAQIKAADGIDLQILGIGRNGHIGFNEPSSSLGSRTRVKTLTTATLIDNKRFFHTNEFQPTMAITMGIATILESRELLLIASGSSKAIAVRAMIEGSISSSCPASALQQHAKVTIIVDQEAAALLSHPEYYQRVRSETEKLREQERVK